jgi:hypothetical protein
MKILSILLLFSVTFLYAKETLAESLANELKISAASKAMIQWERVFKSPRKMKRYKIDTLTDDEKKVLKRYLINHAIDSDQPTIAGV